jgi:hypothetical protein
MLTRGGWAAAAGRAKAKAKSATKNRTILISPDRLTHHRRRLTGQV